MTAPVFPTSSPHATAENAGNAAFAILAGHIFGKNKGERKFAMTGLREASIGAGRNAGACTGHNEMWSALR
jgi:hypothetical protein